MHTSLKCTWKIYNNKDFFGSHTPTLHLKVNNNQPMDLDHNQIMRYIFCHVDFVDLKILAMHTKCMKGLIAYQKTNGKQP